MQKVFSIYPVLIFIFSFSFTFSQSSKIDSLTSRLLQTLHDTDRVNTLLSLGDEIYINNPDSALLVFKQSLEICEKALKESRDTKITNTLLKSKAAALNDIGYIIENQGDIPLSLDYYHQSLKICEEIGDKIGIANLLNNIGTIHYNQGDIPQTLDYYHRSLKIMEEIGDKSGIATLLNNIGTIHYNQGDIPQALDYYHRSLKIREEIGDKSGIAQSLNNIGVIHYNQGDIPQALDYYHRSLKIKEEIGDKNGIATLINNIGYIHSQQGDIPQALDYYHRSLKIMEEIGDKSGIAYSLHSIGSIHDSQGDFPRALDYYHRSLKIRGEIGDKSGIAYSFNNIGAIHMNQGDISQALDYYHRSLKIWEEIGDKSGIALSLNNIGYIHDNQGDISQALDYYHRSLKIREEIGDKSGIALSLNNIGSIHSSRGDIPTALDYYHRSLEIREEIGDKSGIAYSLNNIASIYLRQKKYSLALEYSIKAQKISNEIGAINVEKDCQKTLYKTYKAMGNTKKALEYYEKYILLRDSIFKIDNQKEIIRKQMKFDYEKKAAADSVKNVEEQKVKEAQIWIQQAQIKQERTQRYALYGGLSLAVVFAGFIFNRFRVTKRQNRIIEEQKKMVEMKNEEILDSIQYAQRIQQAMLATDQLLKHSLPEHFIFFKPKDIVSGDFYWVASPPSNPPVGGKDISPSPTGEDRWGAVLLATADCTGHGVPGAFMSLLGISFLNEIIKERNITSPAKALDMLRDEIIRNMNPEGREDIKDGMEIALCKYDFAEKVLEYASANIKLLLVRTPRPPEGGESKSPSGDFPPKADPPLVEGVGKKEIIELETDTMPVGVGFGATKLFTRHRIALEKGDMIYTFSDGFGDQFGGPKGKRFKRGKLNELLLNISDKQVEEQKIILESTFNDWKGNLEQTDDVTVTGIRIS